MLLCLASESLRHINVLLININSVFNDYYCELGKAGFRNPELWADNFLLVNHDAVHMDNTFTVCGRN